MTTNDPMQQILQELRREEQSAQQQARASLAVACKQLTKLGVTKVGMTYDGCGDSGVIESMIAFDAQNKEVTLPDDLGTTLEEAACELMPLGWEQSDGSCGELSLDVASRTITRQHTWRTTEYEEEEISL